MSIDCGVKAPNINTGCKGRVKFYTLGCKVNQYETQAIREQFLNVGFQEIGGLDSVDVCVINTCTVTHRADADSLNYIRRAIKENPAAKIVVTGCLAELDVRNIRKTASASVIVKNRHKTKILNKLFSSNSLIHKFVNYKQQGISSFEGHTRAFLKIQDGCNNLCSYCKVPLVRGKSKSKPLEIIIPEAGRLAKNGFKEIVLCGICLGSYGADLKPKRSLVDVIEALERIGDILRIRLSSIEAGDVSDALISKMAYSTKLCRHLHIPIQSGDDDILAMMRRRYTHAGYHRLIKKIKKHVPAFAITTDVMVGFPSESEVNFENTLRLIREIAPLKVHIFPYSKREKTRARTFLNKETNPFVIKQRCRRLKAISQAMAQDYRKKFINKPVLVLIEGQCADNHDFWEGYTDNYLKVRVKSKKNLQNQLISVLVKAQAKEALLGIKRKRFP